MLFEEIKHMIGNPVQVVLTLFSGTLETFELPDPSPEELHKE